MKLNYKTSYTHATKATETGENLNDIILQKAILPSAGQKLSEAFFSESVEWRNSADREKNSK